MQIFMDIHIKITWINMDHTIYHGFRLITTFRKIKSKLNIFGEIRWRIHQHITPPPPHPPSRQTRTESTRRSSSCSHIKMGKSPQRKEQKKKKEENEEHSIDIFRWWLRWLWMLSKCPLLCVAFMWICLSYMLRVSHRALRCSHFGRQRQRQRRDRHWSHNDDSEKLRKKCSEKNAFGMRWLCFCSAALYAHGRDCGIRWGFVLHKARAHNSTKTKPPKCTIKTTESSPKRLRAQEFWLLGSFVFNLVFIFISYEARRVVSAPQDLGKCHLI